MKKIISILTILLAIGCSGETTEPAPIPTPTDPKPEPTSSSPAPKPLLIQSNCAQWDDALPFRGKSDIKAWYQNHGCPSNMNFTFCNGTEQELVPDNCIWFDMPPNGINPGCCPNDNGDTTPFYCNTSNDCPLPNSDCLEPFCAEMPGQNICMLTGYFKLGNACAIGSSTGICNISGEQRSDITGLLISQSGWPVVCDVPTWPE